MIAVEERFWAKVDRRGLDECWPWTGAIHHDGYGVIGAGGRHGKQVRVHRLAVELDGRVIPDGLTVDHICFTRVCCNPRHLQILTMAENGRRQRKALAPTCSAGHLLDEANTYRKQTRSGVWRVCRTCRRRHVAAYAARRAPRFWREAHADPGPLLGSGQSGFSPEPRGSGLQDRPE